MNQFVLDLNDQTIWNFYEFIEFLTANQGQRIMIEVQEGPCLETLGVYKLLDKFSFESVLIFTHNLLESHPNYNIVKHKKSFQYFDVPTDTNYTQYHTWNRTKTFGVFYNRPTWSRIGLASYMCKNYLDSTLLNFRFNPHDVDQRPMFELEKLFTVDPGSIENFASCYKVFPCQVEQQDGCTVGDTTVNHTNQLVEYYSNFFIDIVAETFINGTAFYPTEKTVRPMLLKKPFIIMGPKCYLIYLRQMGFRTFHNFWNEDYDGYSPEDRYLKILQLIDHLASKPVAELAEMYREMQTILEHNYNLLTTQSYSKVINYVN